MNQLTCIHCGDTYPDFDVAHVCSKGPYAYKIKSMSNNRIEELQKQCWSHRVDGALVDGQLHFDTKKFAELIVAECLGCCEQVISDPVPESVDTWLNGGEQCINEIKKHFGVEE